MTGSEPWPCSTCGELGVKNLGVKNLGVKGYCETHLEELHATFSPTVFARAVQHGAARPDFGPGQYDVVCSACGATWVGAVGEPCEWCEEGHRRMIDHQAELVLRAPDVELDDIRRDAILGGWADRLWVAVEAGLVSRQQAERTLLREVGRAAA